MCFGLAGSETGSCQGRSDETRRASRDNCGYVLILEANVLAALDSYVFLVAPCSPVAILSGGEADRGRSSMTALHSREMKIDYFTQHMMNS